MLLTPRSVRGHLAFWVAHRTASKDLKGRSAPGGGQGKVWVDENGHKFAVIIQGEGFDILVGGSETFQFPISSHTAGAIARWLVWWWVVYAWFGLRFHLWNWAVSVLYSDLENERSNSNSD